MTPEHALLIVPPVFSYHLSIKSELEAMGFVVTWWNDRGRSGTLAKIGLRLFPAVGARLLTRHFLRQISALAPERVSRILVVKGEGLSVGVVEAMRKQWPAARLSLYLWDSVANVRNARSIAPLFDVVATFDPVDASERGWRYRPLFARGQSSQPPVRTSDFRFNWCFIGTLHSDRYRVIDRMRRLDRSHTPFIFCFIPSRLLLVARMLSNWTLWTAPRGTVSTKAMSASEVAAVCDVSRAMLDVEHPRQRGLTMRSIETLLAARKLITTNAHIRESELFDDTRVHVISRSRPMVPAEFYAAEFLPIQQSVMSRYSLSTWLRDLIGDRTRSPDPSGP